jgi:hypothetical protein
MAFTRAIEFSDVSRISVSAAGEFRRLAREAQEPENKVMHKREYAHILKMILPYERPKLQAIKLDGDPNKPILPAEDVAAALVGVLTKDELSCSTRS